MKNKKLIQFYKWWYCDYKPLDGRIKFIVYISLLYLGLLDLLLPLPRMLLHCPPEFFHPSGIMQFLLPSKISLQALSHFLYYAKFVVIFFWLSAATGFLGNFSNLVVAISVLFYWGTYKAFAATGHFWLLPIYSFFVIGLFSKNDAWSLDYFLSKKISWYPFKNFEPNTWKGLPVKLILLFSVYTFFSAGIIKLIVAGPSWATGDTLHQYLLLFSFPKYKLGNWLLQFLLQHVWLIKTAAIFSLLFELISPLVLFSKKYKYHFVALAWLFHIVVYLIMLPRFFTQMICYLFFLDWQEQPIVSASLIATNSEIHSIKIKHLIIPVLAIGLCFSCIVFKIEAFPLSNIPMYSTPISDAAIGNYSRKDFETIDGLKKISKQYSNGDQPFFFMFYYAKKIELRAWRKQNKKIYAENVTLLFQSTIGNRNVWDQEITNITIGDIAAEKILYRNAQSSNNSASYKLLSLVEFNLIHQKKLMNITKLELIYHLNATNEILLVEK